MFSFLGDVQEAIPKIQLYVESDSSFFNAFLKEGMLFSSLLYLILIWIRVLKLIFQNLIEVAEKMKTSLFLLLIIKFEKNEVLKYSLYYYVLCMLKLFKSYSKQ